MLVGTTRSIRSLQLPNFPLGSSGCSNPDIPWLAYICHWPLFVDPCYRLVACHELLRWVRMKFIQPLSNVHYIKPVVSGLWCWFFATNGFLWLMSSIRRRCLRPPPQPLLTFSLPVLSHDAWYVSALCYVITRIRIHCASIRGEPDMHEQMPSLLTSSYVSGIMSPDVRSAYLVLSSGNTNGTVDVCPPLVQVSGRRLNWT